MSGCPGNILETGDTLRLVANVAPEDADDVSVIWTSSNPAVATVDSSGLITALSQGTAKIIVKTNDGGFTSTCTIGAMSTGIPAAAAASQIVEIYPNPVVRSLNLRFAESYLEKRISFYNIYGQLIFDKTTCDANLEINTTEFSSEASMFIVKVTSGKTVASFKVIREL